MNDPAPWAPPPDRPDLAVDEVHVWRIDLDRRSPMAVHWYGWLSGQEQERAESFHRASDRQRFIVAHVALREILSRYLDLPPEHLAFQTNPYGKPALPANHPTFSLAHCQHLALVALSAGRPVGVDVECPRESLDLLPLARRFFSRGEAAALEAVPPEHQMEAFLNAWTRKEAYLKARGFGLSLPLDSFEVSLLPGHPARLLWVRGDPDAPSRWSMLALYPSPGCAAALAVEGPVTELRLFEWRGQR